jgi:predicted RNA-binding Zn-ribbon protein involved in translation (DUF1610 family)
MPVTGVIGRGPTRPLCLTVGGLRFARVSSDSSSSGLVAATHEFSCSLCGAVAATVTVCRAEDHASLVVSGFLGHSTTRLPLLALEPLAGSVRRGDAPALLSVDPEYAPFYCPQCASVFCRGHWRTWSVFDDDGWHDSIRGTCPNGHERQLED